MRYVKASEQTCSTAAHHPGHEEASKQQPIPANHFYVALALSRKYPMVLILPLLLLCVSIPLGIWIVIKASESQASSSRDSMTNLAAALSLNLNGLIQPAITLSTSVGTLVSKGNITAAYNSAQLTDLTSDMVLLANTTGLVKGFSCVPWGRLTSTFGNATPKSWLYLDPLSGPRRPAALDFGRRSNFTTSLSGISPANAVSSDPSQAVDELMITMTVMISGLPTVAQRAEMVGSEPRCPEGVCYNISRNVQWWGTIATLIDARVVARALQQQAMAAGGRFTMRAPAGPFTPAYTVAASQDGAPALGSAVAQHVGMNDDQWVLYVAPVGGWYVSWKVPAIVAVVVGSLLLAACVMAMALYRAHYLSLLESILPKAALKQIVHDAKLQGRVELGMSMPGTTAELILHMMKQLLLSPVEGITTRDVITVQSVLHSTANIYTPMWQDAKSLSNLDDDVMKSLKTVLGAQRPSPAGDAMIGAQIQRDTSGSSDAAAAADPAGGEEDGVLETLGSALVFIAQHNFQHALEDDDDAQSVSSSGALLLPRGRRSSVNSAVPLMTPVFDCAFNAQQQQQQQQQQRGGKRALSWIQSFGGQSASASSSLKLLLASVAGSAGSASSSIATAAAAATAFGSVGGCSAVKRSGSTLTKSTIDRQILLLRVESVLSTAESFTFDAFMLHEASNGHALSSLAYHCMLTTGVVQRLGINRMTLCRWLLRIEAGYDAGNPYHNATHAADVLQTYHALLTRGGLAPAYACNDLWHLACYLAAIVHDVGHVGCTNDFLINTGHDLAILFNDRAPLENMHMSNAWTLLLHPDYNFLAHLPKADLMLLRRAVIDLVLATDMKQHFSLVGQFNAMHGVGPEVLAADKARMLASPLQASSSTDMRASRSSANLQRCNTSEVARLAAVGDAERLLALQVALKCADLGHTTADLTVHQRWVSVLEEEFFRQGDVEKARGLPISPLFDRTKQGVSKSQVGFYEVVVLPLYSSFSHVFPQAEPLTAGAISNFRYWKQLSERSSGSNRS